jgi:hypothetical protein
MGFIGETAQLACELSISTDHPDRADRLCEVGLFGP